MARKKSVKKSGKKSLGRFSKVTMSDRLNVAKDNFVAFLIMFVVSFVLYSFSTNNLFITFFGILSIITGFILLAFFIVLIVLTILSYSKSRNFLSGNRRSKKKR